MVSFAAAIAAGAIAASPIGAHSRTTRVTWTVDVGPIVASRCATCHTTDGFAPMPLHTFEETRAWAKEIRDEVLAGAINHGLDCDVIKPLLLDQVHQRATDLMTCAARAPVRGREVRTSPA